VELLVGDKLGKYEVLGRVAAGGMAEVYLARSVGHGGFAKTVALKRMLPELASDPGFRDMFMQEAAVAARLSHPHIVQIFDFAEDAGELYLAMEFVHGVTLRTLQKDALAQPAGAGLRIPPLLAAHVARCVARALAYAWQVPNDQGEPTHLVHRDVSPHNILLSYEGDAKLADFGIAKPAERHTSAGTLKGKLLYMAPEQLAGQPLDARCDLFALGIVLYETAMNLRKPLFDAGGEEGVKRAVAERLVVPPERMDPEFPRALSQVIMKALERDRDQRYASAAELADALGEAIHLEAKGPQDHDLVAFLRRLYGEPPPIRGASRAPAGPQNRTGAAPSELERGGNDPLAPTLRREDLPAQPRALERQTAAERPEPGPSLPARSRRIALGSGAAAILGLLVAGVWGAMRLLPPAARADGSIDLIQSLPPLPGPAIPPDPLPGPPPPSIQGPGNAPVPSDQGSSLIDDLGQNALWGDAGSGFWRRANAPLESQQGTAGSEPGGVVVIRLRPWGYAWFDGETFDGSKGQEIGPFLRRKIAPGRHVMHLRGPTGKNHDHVLVVPGDRDLLIEGSFEHLSIR
jgi:serine/threonine-protein kinase